MNAMIAVPHYHQSTKDDDHKENEPKQNRQKKPRSVKTSDDVIIAFWKQNPDATLLKVQQKYNAGYNRVKRLKDIALSDQKQKQNMNNRMIVSSDDENDDDEKTEDMDTPQNKEKKKKKKKRKRRDSISSYNTSDDDDDEYILDETKAKKQCVSAQDIQFNPDEMALFFEEKNPTRKRRAKWIQKTHKALEYLKKDISAYFFLKPVDKELCAAYDYDLVISQPMDFETLQNNLEKNKYLTISDFVADIELIFINAKIYNPPNHSVHKAAESLQKLFKSNFQSIIGEHGDPETLKRWTYLDRPGGFAYGYQHQQQQQA